MSNIYTKKVKAIMSNNKKPIMKKEKIVIVVNGKLVDVIRETEVYFKAVHNTFESHGNQLIEETRLGTIDF